MSALLGLVPVLTLHTVVVPAGFPFQGWSGVPAYDSGESLAGGQVARERGEAWAVFPPLESEEIPITTLCCSLLCGGWPL